MATGLPTSAGHPGQLNWSIDELRHDKTKFLEAVQEFRYAAHHNWEFLDDVTQFLLETKEQQNPIGSLVERFKTPLAKASSNRKLNLQSTVQKKLFAERHPLAEFDASGAHAEEFERQRVETQKMMEHTQLLKEKEEAHQERERRLADEKRKIDYEHEMERQRQLKEQQEREEREREEREREEREREEREREEREREEREREEREREEREQEERERLRRENEKRERREREERERERKAREEQEARERSEQEQERQLREHEKQLELERQRQVQGEQQPQPRSSQTTENINNSPMQQNHSSEEDVASDSSVTSSPNMPAPVRKSSLNFASLPAREPVRKSSGRQSPLKHVKNKFSTILKNGRGLLASSAAVSADAKASVLPSEYSSSDARPSSVLTKTSSTEFRSAAPTTTNYSTSTLHLPGKFKNTMKDPEDAQRRREETLAKEREEQARKIREMEEESRRQEQRLQAARQEQQRRAAERAQAEEKEREKREKENQKKRLSTEINRGLDEYAARMAARENDNKLKDIQRQREEVEKTRTTKEAKERIERQQRLYTGGGNSRQPDLIQGSKQQQQITRPPSSAKILMPSQERQKRMVEEASSQRPWPQAVRPSLKHQASQEQVPANAKRIRVSKDPESQQQGRLKGPPIRPSGGTKKPTAWNGGGDIAPPSQMAYSQPNGPKQTKAAHPLDMAKISKATIPFAPNPNPAGSAFKTPARPEPTAKSAHKPSPQLPSGESIELPEIFTDDEDDDYDDALVPSWANTPNITEQLLRQETINPMKIFGQPQPLDMEKVFEKSKDRFSSFRKRTSSANWSAGDQLSVDEIRKDLAARKKMRKDGGWSMDLAHHMS